MNANTPSRARRAAASLSGCPAGDSCQTRYPICSQLPRSMGGWGKARCGLSRSARTWCGRPNMNRMQYGIAFVAAALLAVSVLLTSIYSPPVAAGAYGKGAGFAKDIYKKDKQKQTAGKGKKKQGN